MGANGDVARRWFREAWLPDGEHVVDELLAEDCEGWMEGRFVDCRDAFKTARHEMLEIFPDLTITTEDTVEEGDTVVVRWSVKATHRGPGLGMPPTNQAVTFRGTTWLEFRNGQIVRGWDSWNLGGVIMTLKEAAERAVAKSL